MRTVALMVGAWLSTAGGACASPHAGPKEATRPDPDATMSDDALHRLRQENSALKRRVQMLEDRMLMLERGPRQDNSALGSEQVGSTSTSAFEHTAPRTRGASSHARHAASPRAAGRGAISLARVPNSAGAAEYSDEVDDWDDRDDAWQGDGDDATRSYRLVGAQLVEQTKSKGPARPDRPQRDPRGREIIAEYEAAMKVYKAGDFAVAQQAFEAFARRHPGHDYADNALYWKGEAAYDQHHYADALAAFTEVVERYGGGNKAPDALLKIGLCYEKIGDLANARDVLSQLVAAYPGARASEIARVRLTELGA